MKSKLPKMRADRPLRLVLYAMLSLVLAFAVSLLVPDEQLGQVTFAVLAALLYFGLDLRDRLVEIFLFQHLIVRRLEEQERDALENRAAD